MIRRQTGGADGLAGVVVARTGLWGARVGGVEACLAVETVSLDLVWEWFLVGVLRSGGGGGAFFVMFGGDRVSGVVGGVDEGVLWVEDLFDGIHDLFAVVGGFGFSVVDVVVTVCMVSVVLNLW